MPFEIISAFMEVDNIYVHLAGLYLIRGITYSCDSALNKYIEIPVIIIVVYSSIIDGTLVEKYHFLNGSYMNSEEKIDSTLNVTYVTLCVIMICVIKLHGSISEH